VVLSKAIYNEEQVRGSAGRQAGRQLRVAVLRSEKLVAEARDSSGTQRKGNACRWKPLPSNTVKTMTEKTSLCVIVIFRCSHELFKTSFNIIPWRLVLETGFNWSLSISL
jgi:hypothetical protein